MKRFFFHLCAVTVLLCFVCATSAATKPNFIIILADDLGWTDLGCYGSRFYQTPNIDRLAATGMKFTDAYAGAPVCSPTRAAILTGKSPTRLGLTEWIPGKKSEPTEKLLAPPFKKELETREVTLPEMLKAEGYVSGAVGKWHLGSATGKHHGFDVDIGGSSAGSPASYFSPYKSGKKAMPLKPGKEGEYLTDRLTDEAISFIKDHQTKPFFLYLPHHAVHTPLQGKLELVQKYEKLANTNSPQHHAVYAAMVESLDDSVGRIVETLNQLNLSERTYVIFTSDNGGLGAPKYPGLSNVPLRATKGHVYEGGIRVPLIISCPGTIKPQVCNAPAISMDFVPTILELAGATNPKDLKLDGVSLVPLFKKKKLRRDELYWHYPHYSPQGGVPGAAVRQGDFKLIEWYETGKVDLFNLREDLGETQDLSGKLQKKTAELQKKLNAWRKESGALMPIAKAKE